MDLLQCEFTMNILSHEYFVRTERKNHGELSPVPH